MGASFWGAQHHFLGQREYLQSIHSHLQHILEKNQFRVRHSVTNSSESNRGDLLTPSSNLFVFQTVTTAHYKYIFELSFYCSQFNRDRSANDFLTVLRKCGTLTGRRRWDRSRFSHSDARNAAATVGSHVMVLFFPLPMCTLSDLLTLSAIYGA
ncbi:hypothetical protein CDAR_108941 [Caerostris darwini]|uniref:Uncharacterized protein n=1 Tax=Caerostris darwini TaxID=1538125 RepID=A0AAV4QRU4_9ARAC|nr:hypothetical protein CDAR_108941 [Caerostris darwini]